MRTKHAWCWMSAVALFAVPCAAQCSEWDDRFQALGTSGGVLAFATYDSGAGPNLFVGGSFSIAGGIGMQSIAAWDGSQWYDVGGIYDVVDALVVFDDGTGPALYAGGNFNVAGATAASGIAKWNGSSWSALGAGVNVVQDHSVFAMAVFDDGAGPALYAGGDFTTAGGSTATSIAKWNGSTWSALANGTCSGPVYSLAVFDDGTGAALYAGGGFTQIGGTNANAIAKWDGTSWSPLGSGMQSGGVSKSVHAMCVFHGPGGPRLCAGGEFFSAGGVTVKHIAAWDGASWASLGGGVDGPGGPRVLALAELDDGNGNALYVGGNINVTGGGNAARIAKWNGTSWSAMESGTSHRVRALLAYDDGNGPALAVGGDFTVAGGHGANHVAEWKASGFESLDSGLGLTISGDVIASTPMVSVLRVADDGSGDALFAGGPFTSAGDVDAKHIAKWNGTSWSAVGGGFNGSDVRAIEEFDDGTGPAVYVGGEFSGAGGSTAKNFARWDGAAWSEVGGGTNDAVRALVVFDDGSGPALYVGGEFQVVGSIAARRIAKWDGSSWSPVGVGMGVGSSPSEHVNALAVHDDGTGPALYVGGRFFKAGVVFPATTVDHVARWDGVTWSSVGTGFQHDDLDDVRVNALAVFDDGTGPKLYAGGRFTHAGAVDANFIARWDGVSWSSLAPPSFDGGAYEVLTFSEFDDGGGRALVVGGIFGDIGGVPMDYLAKWDGVSFSPFEIELNAPVSALTVFDDGADGTPDLYAGGRFTFAGPRVSSGFAQWHACPPGEGYCFGDGVDSIVTAPCPCSNIGGEGRGCANSNPVLGGAHLIASGSTNPNTLLFTCDGIPNNTFCTFLRSNASLDTGFVFGDGIKCLNGTGVRFGAQNAGQNGNPSNTVASTAASFPSGTTRYYQVHYRNPNAGFCPPELFNISNGYRVIW